VQHIYVKPASGGLEASLVINTDLRSYHAILRSFKDVHMPIVRWRYAAPVPNNYIAGPPQGAPQGMDPRLLSFNYRMTYPLFKKPAWLPELVFDDGGKTFIVFPDMVLQRELPAVFENRRDVLNYVVDNLVVIDRLADNITVKLERSQISISKKRANGK